MKLNDKEKCNPIYEYIQTKLDNYKSKLKFACFTSTNENDILMWAHYANSCKGFVANLRLKIQITALVIQ